MNAPSLLPTPSSPPPKRGVWGLALVFFFLLLAWGLWWYFDYKLRSLNASLPP